MCVLPRFQSKRLKKNLLWGCSGQIQNLSFSERLSDYHWFSLEFWLSPEIASTFKMYDMLVPSVVFPDLDVVWIVLLWTERIWLQSGLYDGCHLIQLITNDHKGKCQVGLFMLKVSKLGTILNTLSRWYSHQSLQIFNKSVQDHQSFGFEVIPSLTLGISQTTHVTEA